MFKPQLSGEVIDSSDIYIAEVLQDDIDGYKTGTPMLLAPSASIAEATATTTTPSYYSGQAFYIYVSEGVSTLTLITPYYNAETEAYIRGKQFDTTQGMMIDTGSPKNRYFAMGFKTPMSDGKDMYVWWFKGSFAIASRNLGQTSTDTITPQQLTVTYSAITTINKATLPDGEENGLKKVQGDVTHPNFVSQGFLDSVPFPTAPLTPIQHTIQVAADNAVNGTVTVTPFGNQPKDTILTLTATANTGFTFDHWTSDAGGTFADVSDANTTFITPNNDVNITAVFV